MAVRGLDRKAMAGKIPPPDRRVDILVIGGGSAGAAAAIAAAGGGASVMLVDENPVGPGLMGLDTPLYFGGRYTDAVRARPRMIEQVFAARPALADAFEAGVEIELGVCCWGAYTPGYGLASLPGSIAGLADDARSWLVGFDRLILATGARDVAFSFKGWDQPGVMGAQALHALLATYGAFAGRRIAILGLGELALRTALFALSQGVAVAAMVEVEAAPLGPSNLVAEVRAAGVELFAGHVPVGASGGLEGVEGLRLRSLAGGGEVSLACDTIVEAISLTPAVELLDVVGARLRMQPGLGGYAPDSSDGVRTSLEEVFVAGDAAGVPGGAWRSAAAARASGRRAAQAALASLGRSIAIESPPATESSFDAVACQQAWTRALMANTPADVVICQCEEVTREALLAVRQPAYLGPPPTTSAARDLGRLLEDGPANPDQIKRLTRAGMGPCQGRRCREQIALALACASNEPPQRLPLAGYRAPVRPLPLSVLAATDEPAGLAADWDVWFGIPGQWTPYADIGTEREALHTGTLGGATVE